MIWEIILHEYITACHIIGKSTYNGTKSAFEHMSIAAVCETCNSSAGGGVTTPNPAKK